MQIQIKQAAKNSETLNLHIAKGPNNELAICILHWVYTEKILKCISHVIEMYSLPISQ